MSPVPAVRACANRRYSPLRARPSSNTTMRRDDVRALHVADVEALDPQRRDRQVQRLLQFAERPRPGGEVGGRLSLCWLSDCGGVAAHRLGQRPLVAALRHAQRTREPRRALSHSVSAAASSGSTGTSTSRGDALGRPRAVELGDELLDELAVGRPVEPVDDPAALAAHPSAADVEHLDGRLELVLGERDDVGVGAVAEHDGLLLQGAAQRLEVVAQPGGELELEVVARLVHPPLEPLDHHVGLAGHEVAEVVDDLAVLVRGDPADARRAALADVAEQARPADLPGALEHAGAAGARREHPQQQVERLADRPRVAVRAEVAHALALRRRASPAAAGTPRTASRPATGRTCRRGSGR